MGLLEWGSLKKDTGTIEIIGAAAKGAAKFVKQHAKSAAAAAVAAGVGGTAYVANNYKSEGGANGGGTVMKQNVAEKDAKGDLRVNVQGTKPEAPKAVESAKSDAKSGNGDALKGLKEALDAAKDADIKAEAAKAFEPKVEEAPKPEKLYIPETDAKGASYNDTNANLWTETARMLSKRHISHPRAAVRRAMREGRRRNLTTKAQRKLLRERVHPLRHPQQRRREAA